MASLHGAIDGDGFKALAADLARAYCSGSPSSVIGGPHGAVASPASTVLLRRVGGGEQQQRQRALMPRAEGAASVVPPHQQRGNVGYYTPSPSADTSYAFLFDNARSRRDLVTSFLGLDQSRRIGASPPPPPPTMHPLRQAPPAPPSAPASGAVATGAALLQLHEQLARMRSSSGVGGGGEGRQATSANANPPAHPFADPFAAMPTTTARYEIAAGGVVTTGTAAPPPRRRQLVQGGGDGATSSPMSRAPEWTAVPQSRVPSNVPGATPLFSHHATHTGAAALFHSPPSSQHPHATAQRSNDAAEFHRDLDSTPQHFGDRRSGGGMASVSPLTAERGGEQMNMRSASEDEERVVDGGDGVVRPKWTREASMLRRSEEPRHDAPPRPLGAHTQRRDDTQSASTAADQPPPNSVPQQRGEGDASAQDLQPRDRILGKIVDRVAALQARLTAQQGAVVRRHATQSLETDKVRRAATNAEYRLSESTVDLETRLSQLQQRLQDRVATQRKLRVDASDNLAALIRQTLHRVPSDVQQQAIRAVGTSMESIQLSAEALLTSLAQQQTHADMQLSSLLHRSQKVQRQVREQLAAVHHIAVTRLLPSALEDASTYSGGAGGIPEIDLSRPQNVAVYVSRPRVGGAKTLKTMFDTLTQFLHQSRWQLEDLRKDRIAFEEHFIGRVAMLASQSPQRTSGGSGGATGE